MTVITARLFVGVYVALFLASLAFIVRRTRRMTGRSPIIRHKSSDRPLMAFAERAVLASYFLLILNALFFAFGYEPFVFFEEFEFPRGELLRGAGVFVAGVSLVLLFTAQFQMGDSWRIGIDDRRSTEMVNRGLFRFLRHPVYLFAVLEGVSLFLIVPHAMSLVSLAALYLALSFQARMEEEFLLRRWGGRYRRFMLSRRRWF